MTGRGGRVELTRLIERSGELKRDLVDFACSSRLERSLAAAMAEAGLEEFEDADAIGIIDRFALQYRLPDGKTVVDRFVASRPVAGAWLVSGTMSSYRKCDAGWIAKAALELATKRRELVFRNHPGRRSNPSALRSPAMTAASPAPAGLAVSGRHALA